jgi:hypothetical protein
MRISEIKPEAVEGDRFDENDTDVSQQPDLEDDPAHPEDILPDRIEELPWAAAEEEGEEITARPSEENRPISPDHLP